MAVYIPIGIAEVQDAQEKPSRTYRLDLDAGRIVGFVDNLEAVQQAIRKAIITPVSYTHLTLPTKLEV